MKKLTSLLLVLVMVLSVLSTFVVFTSAAGNELKSTYEAAAEGDLLYEAKFGQTTGVYQPSIMAVGNASDPSNTAVFSTEVSADGSQLKINYTPDKARRLFYGAPIDGLTIGGGKKYTIEYWVHTADTTKTTNFGVYFNYPASFEESELVLRTEYQYLLGYYGTPRIRSTLDMGGAKYTGKYISSDNDYITSHLFPTNADGFNKVTIEVEDNAFRVYIDGTFFDEGVMYDGQVAKCPNLGLVFYVYNTQTYSGDTFTVKDVKVYKGHTQQLTAKYPDYYKPDDGSTTSTNVLLKSYADAADGEKLYAVKMDATDGVFVPKVWREVSPTTMKITSTSIEFSNNGVEGGHWWGGVIEGLKVTADTKYTMEAKVQSKAGGKNGGFGFVTAQGSIIDKCFNFYGFFNKVEGSTNDEKTVIQRGTTKIPGLNLGTTDYTFIYPVLDENGFIDVMVEIDGFVFSVYYKSTSYGVANVDPYWALFESYDMSEDLEYFGEADLCFMTYTHNTNTNWMIKDVNVYKGLTVDKTVPEAPTTEAPVTTTPTETTGTSESGASTTDASVNTNPPAATTEPADEGCGGMVAGGMAVIAIVALGALAISKKKD